MDERFPRVPPGTVCHSPTLPNFWEKHKDTAVNNQPSTNGIDELIHGHPCLSPCLSRIAARIMTESNLHNDFPPVFFIFHFIFPSSRPHDPAVSNQMEAIRSNPSLQDLAINTIDAPDPGLLQTRRQPNALISQKVHMES